MFTAYTRDLNAGFATETVLLNGEVIIDQIVSTYNAASTIEGLPNLIGQPVDALEGKGFKRIRNQQRVDELVERSQER